jgi:phosphoribosylanthranilate isomerase
MVRVGFWRSALKVKICGNTKLEDASLAVSAGADGLGFLIGLRYRTDDEITVPQAAEIIDAVPPLVATVLVTHRGDAAWVIETCRSIGANTIQLHAEFNPSDVPWLRAELRGVKLIKAVQVRGVESIADAAEASNYYDAILVDSATATRIGGTGETHDWSISSRIVKTASVPVILAGGLTPENVREAIITVKPYAVDVNSGVEFPDGRKSPERVRSFVRQAHDAFKEVAGVG